MKRLRELLDRDDVQTAIAAAVGFVMLVIGVHFLG